MDSQGTQRLFDATAAQATQLISAVLQCFMVWRIGEACVAVYNNRPDAEQGDGQMASFKNLILFDSI